ncbi:MAG: hypothetical protein ACI4LX_03950 [Treponema sp.]
MKKKFLFRLFIINSIIAVFSSCSKKAELNKADNSEPQKLITTHSWYCLKSDGFEEIDLPGNAPLVIKKPWTESLRISGMGQTAFVNSESKVNSPNPKVYALVNHLGIIEFDGDKKSVFADKMIFKNITAEGIVFMNDNPVFSLYKNNFFNTSSTEHNAGGFPILAQFDTDSKIFFPILNSMSLNLPPTSQVSDFFWDGTYWFYCIKNSLENKTEFSYLKWKPSLPLLSIVPPNSEVSSEKKISLQNSSEDEFRKCKKINSFAHAPERVKKLLACLPKDFNFSIECKTAGGPSSRFYENKTDKNGVTEKGAEGKIQLADTWVAAVFKDGTMYFSGALYNKHILNNSKTIALRLPKLPENFVYSDFGISGSFLYAAWEEVSFYETGRAGFLSVDLEKVLYNDF